MPAERRHKRTIKHALFTYALPDGGEALAFRGDTVELNAEDVKRGEKFDAFTDEVGVKPGPEGSKLPEYELDGDESVQDAWVVGGTEQEILDAVNLRPEIADSVLAAELRRKDSARRPLLEALGSFTGSGIPAVAVTVPAPADYASLAKPDLEAEIAKRNDGRDVDKVIKPSGENKSDLVAALEADDAAKADA